MYYTVLFKWIAFDPKPERFMFSISCLQNKEILQTPFGG